MADRVQTNADRTNIIYGALNPMVNRVYSVHGEFDPWAPMGVKENINVMSPTTICPRENLIIYFLKKNFNFSIHFS